MSLQKAVLQYSKGGPLVLKEIEKHKPNKDELLIKVHAVATNPIDWKMAKHGYYMDGKHPFIFGFDVAGTVEEVGEGVTAFKIGDSVFAWLNGIFESTRLGGFQEFTIAQVPYTALKPSNFSFEEAACLGVPPLTALMGLFSKQYLNIPYPKDISTKLTQTKDSPVFFVNGGSSAVGASVVQFAVLAGFRVIATSSPKNFDFVRSLGASDVLDYNDKQLVQNVKKSAGKEINYAYDAITNNESVQQAIDILDKKGQLVVVLNPNENLDHGTTIIHRVVAYKVSTDEDMTRWVFPFLRSLCEQGKFVVNKPIVVAKGLSGEEVQKILDYHEKGVSASRPILQVI